MIILLAFFSDTELFRTIYKEVNVSEQFQNLTNTFQKSLNPNECYDSLENCQLFDLLFTMKINLNYEKEDLEMFIDLINPLSWYKSPDCEFQDQFSVNQTVQKKSCFVNNNQQPFKIDQEKKESQMNAFNLSMKGNLVASQIIINDEALYLQMLQVDTIIGKRLQPFDGLISISHFPGSDWQDFIQMYFLNQAKILFNLIQPKKIKNQSGIETNEKLLKLDRQFQQKFVLMENQSKQYLILEQILLISDQDYYEAILILNSYFISFPPELCDRFIEKLKSYNASISCWYADSELFVILCKNLDETLKNNFTLNLTIFNSNIKIQLNILIYNFNQDYCLFKIKRSLSNFIVLGEPFFNQKNYQIVFNCLTKQIGIYQEIFHPLKTMEFKYKYFLKFLRNKVS